MRSERIKGNVLLFTLATQGFETYHLLGQLVIAEDQCVKRTALVGLLELAFEAGRWEIGEFWWLKQQVQRRGRKPDARGGCEEVQVSETWSTRSPG